MKSRISPDASTLPRLFFLFAWLPLAFPVVAAAEEDAKSPPSTRTPNVLFIAVDDLRPALGCYGDETAITPEMDRLAQRGTVFTRAYCQEAVCAPSRLSLLSGLRPDTIQVWDLDTHYREALPDLVSLPQHFKKHGYHTRSIGKIFHGGGKPSKDPPSWSVPPLYDTNRQTELHYAAQENLKGEGLKRNAAEAADVPDSRYIDGTICEEAIEALGEMSQSNDPFFLAVGFKKPHLPFCAPQRYWDFYDREKIPGPVSSNHPVGAPEFAIRSWMELEGYRDIPEDGRLTPEKVKELRHGYYACVSYVDALVGRLLDTLKELDLQKSTAICLWGDHGFHLGEQGLWTKANNYELSTKVPLIFALPNHPRPGAKSRALVELVDVYPTLADACGIPSPEGLEGISLMPLFADPEKPWKLAAFSQFPRHRTEHRYRRHGDLMGYAMRTDQYRYVEWRDWATGKVESRELYDHALDAEEMFNLADSKEHETLISALQKQLADGWKHALPVSGERGTRSQHRKRRIDSGR